MTASLSRLFSRLVRPRALPYKTDMISLHAARDAATPLELMERHAEEGARLRHLFFQEAGLLVRQAAYGMAVALAAGGKLLLCGSGGGFLMARQMSALLTGRFLLDRPALPAILLPEAGVPSEGGQAAFARQIEALGTAGDGLLLFSPSEPCPALLAAAETARHREMYVAAFTGERDGDLGAHSDILLCAPHTQTPLVQEIHMAAGHLVCRLLDYYLFENPAALRPAAATA